MRQAFRSEDESMSDIMQRSILGHILPEAMVCYLENYSEEKFAKIFLGMMWVGNLPQKTTIKTIAYVKKVCIHKKFKKNFYD